MAREPINWVPIVGAALVGGSVTFFIDDQNDKRKGAASDAALQARIASLESTSDIQTALSIQTVPLPKLVEEINRRLIIAEGDLKQLHKGICK